MDDHSNIGEPSRNNQYIGNQYYGTLHTKNAPITGSDLPFVYDAYGNKSTLQLGTETIAIDDYEFNVQTLIDSFYPINSIKLTMSSSAPNIPNTEWERVSKGRFLVGAGTGYDKYGNIETFGVGENNKGEYVHTLTVSEMPKHTHDISIGDSRFKYFVMWSALGRIVRQEAENGSTGAYLFPSGGFHTSRMSSSGKSKAHQNTPPSFGVYVWKRIS